jgi:hypothetical protein
MRTKSVSPTAIWCDDMVSGFFIGSCAGKQSTATISPSRPPMAARRSRPAELSIS